MINKSKKNMTKFLIICLLICFTFNKNTYAMDQVTFKTLVELKNQFKDSNMIIIPIPNSVIINELNDESVKYGQVEINKSIEKAFANTNIKVVDCCDEIIKHIDENLYFKSDSHWQSRGAYYAYKKFCEEIGEECPSLDSYRKVTLNEKFVGDLYKNTDKKVNGGVSDELVAYISSVSNIMTIYDNNNEKIMTGMPCINEYKKTYFGAFLGGSGYYTEIEAFNDKTKTALVIKDSFGFPFIPYLVSNYDIIYVLDPRFADFNLKEKMKDIRIDDIIVINVNYAFTYNGFSKYMQKLLAD